MNPLTKVKLINELNEREASLGVKESVSWHTEYKDSAWIFVGGFPYELTEGDLVCVFSQYGEVVNINLVRDKKTGKSKGFCFICYEDQRSTILSVDNFNGIKIKGRTIRVDHVANYRPPKDSDDIDDVTKTLREQGCAPKLSSSESEEEDDYAVPMKKPKKDKKEKKKKKKEKKEEKKKKKAAAAATITEDRRSDGSQSSLSPSVHVKKEKTDAGYEKYNKKGPMDTRPPRGERAEPGTHSARERERERERQEEGSSRDWHTNDHGRDRERERLKEEDGRKDWTRDARDARGAR
ncbi:RNA-binding motif protein, X-linked 2-like, partial [Clupea harengus]|uniref:RNA-binding motif protein, X-linked 2 n=1 Tax=Clupea harengus TaxID=7950 RepID=A0A8M1KNH9_CLUHA